LVLSLPLPPFVISPSLSRASEEHSFSSSFFFFLTEAPPCLAPVLLLSRQRLSSSPPPPAPKFFLLLCDSGFFTCRKLSYQAAVPTFLISPPFPCPFPPPRTNAPKGQRSNHLPTSSQSRLFIAILRGLFPPLFTPFCAWLSDKQPLSRASSTRWQLRVSCDMSSLPLLSCHFFLARPPLVVGFRCRPSYPFSLSPARCDPAATASPPKRVFSKQPFFPPGFFFFAPLASCRRSTSGPLSGRFL